MSAPKGINPIVCVVALRDQNNAISGAKTFSYVGDALVHCLRNQVPEGHHVAVAVAGLAQPPTVILIVYGAEGGRMGMMDNLPDPDDALLDLLQGALRAIGL